MPRSSFLKEKANTSVIFVSPRVEGSGEQNIILPNRPTESLNGMECPVCTEQLLDGSDGVPDNGLVCSNAHAICVDCVGRLAEPSFKCSPTCSMLKFTCPLCRVTACLDNLQLLVVTKRSWDKAYACFPCEHARQAFNERA